MDPKQAAISLGVSVETAQDLATASKANDSDNATGRSVTSACARVVVLLIAANGAFACGSAPSPKLPGDPCHEGTCPDGMRCETPVETHQRGGKRYGPPIKTHRPECLLLPERCVSAADCSKQWMKCEHRSSTPDNIGFCVPPPMS
jgi:hypothetical protein